MGTLKSLSRGLNYLDLSRTGLTTKCIAKIAETLSQSQTLLTSLRTLKFADNGQKGEDFSVSKVLIQTYIVLFTKFCILEEEVFRLYICFCLVHCSLFLKVFVFV